MDTEDPLQQTDDTHSTQTHPSLESSNNNNNAESLAVVLPQQAAAAEYSTVPPTTTSQPSSSLSHPEDENSSRNDQQSKTTTTTVVSEAPSFPPEGGPLWELAAQQARQRHHRPLWTEPLFVGMQSRAQPLGEMSTLTERQYLVTNIVNDNDDDDDDDDDDFWSTTPSKATERVHVTQLLCLGIVGILVGWLGNVVVGTSCHFASAPLLYDAPPDENNNSGATVHYGLYKYSTIDASLNGYKYCYPYEDLGPLGGRIGNTLAMVSGTISLVIVWSYLICGTVISPWKYTTYGGYGAAFFQLFSLVGLWEPPCRYTQCRPGPAAYLTVVVAVLWILLAWELQHHDPETRTIKKESVVELGDYEPPRLAQAVVT